MAYDGRSNIIEIDDSTKTVYFETWKTKKITGSKLGGIMGVSEFDSEFKIACELAGIYPGDKANKYIDAGNILEPVLRKYLGERSTTLLKGILNVPDGVKIGVEEPVAKEQCGYDHFHDNKRFGGMVDGYIVLDGKRDSILEIKTSSSRDKWLDSDGNITQVPEAYIMQAALYAELAGLNRIVFLVGFLEEDVYVRPKTWVPDESNTALIVMEKPEMKSKMEYAEEWYQENVAAGVSPEWTDKDKEIVKYLKAGVKW